MKLPALALLQPCPGMIFEEDDGISMYEECETCLRRKVNNNLPPIKPPAIIVFWCEYSVHE